MENINPLEILKSLPSDYFVIDINSHEILQSNNPKVEVGSKCFRSVFNKNKPCGIKDGQCLCRQKYNPDRKVDFVIENEEAGEQKYYNVAGRFIRKDMILLSLSDITDYVQKQAEAKVYSKRLQGAEKLANYGYWEIDPKTQTISASEGSKLIYGISKDTISLEEVSAYTFPEYKELFGENVTALINHGKGFDMKYKIKRPSDNVVRYIHAIAEFRPKKKIGYGIVLDLTEAAEAKDELKKHEEYLKLLFENMNSAFAQYKIICNKQGEAVDYEFLDVNMKFEELTGLKKEQVLNKTAKQVMPQIEDRWIKRYGKVALTGEPTEFTDYSADVDKYFQVSAYSPQKDFFAVSFSDVTDKRKTELELIEAKEKAEESDRLKTMFLANMSHEIRTPLNGILGFSKLISESELDEEQRRHYAKIIEASGKQLTTIVDDILNISIIQSNQLVLEHSEFDLNDLLLEIYMVYRQQNEAKLTRIDFKLCLDPNHKIELVYSDKNRIFQIMQNLLDNAFKFTREGVIEFGVKCAGSRIIEMYVKDSGIGFDESKKSVIFESFRQAEEGQARKYGGSGLGLAIVIGILEKMDGTITVDSKPGVGSEFCLKIPRNMPQINMFGGIGSPDEAREEIAAGSKKIVSFEDDFVSIEFLKIVICAMGYEWENFVFAREGIEYLRNNKADLVLMDVHLPEMNGYEATKIIKSEFPGIPVVIQTAFAMAGDKEKALKSGCDDYMSKPLTLDVLRQKIDKYLAVES
jgi:PAS domain S-box-containing protein